MILRHHVITGRLFTAYPVERNKTCVILLRSMDRCVCVIQTLDIAPPYPENKRIKTATRRVAV